MTAVRDGLDAYARPPEDIRLIYKKYQTANVKHLQTDRDLVDFSSSDEILAAHTSKVAYGRVLEQQEALGAVFRKFLGPNNTPNIDMPNTYSGSPYEISALPVQQHLLDTLLHRDLSNSVHRTNVHLQYDLCYPPGTSSFFSVAGSDLSSQPKDASVHKAISTTQLLNKKLRWMTLGGQYDWTKKVYPTSQPPAFPSDIKGLIEEIFPMKAEAAIVNLYSPGDTLSLHRDVSEECDRPLVSVSIGCDAIFIAGLGSEGMDGGTDVTAMRLRSGDAVLMTGASRFAWHGVPKILEGTCPAEVADWPGGRGAQAYGTDTARWQGWMKRKRINLNVRQMFP
nr:alpha-ketoglutarate-dependent dioxygenase abh1 [Quercus suber]